MERLGTWPTECIFCHTPEITDEHVFAKKWMRELIPKGSGEMMVAQVDKGRDPVVRFYRTRDVDVIARCVCGDRCNSGWMNNMDERTQPLLAPLVASLNRVALTPEDQRRLATWATKLAIVLDYSTTTDEAEADARPLGVVKEPVHRYFYEERLPPDYVHVWLAAQKDPEPPVLSIAGGNQAPRPTLMGVPLLGAKRHQMYVATFRVNHAIFQVFIPDLTRTGSPSEGGSMTS